MFLFARGVNGQVKLKDGKIIIKRQGFVSKISHGLKGDKSILINRISSVQFKKAGTFTNGYIQFAFSGSDESKSGIIDATKDENTVMFNKKQQPDFIKIKKKVDELMSQPKQSTSGNSNNSDLNDLEKLAELKDKGIITEEEFAAKKKQILGI